MSYNFDFIKNVEIFNQEELESIKSFSNGHRFSDFKDNSRLIEKLAFDFIYVSAKIEGNTYTIPETLTLLETNLPSSSKSIDDAIMILNLKEAFDYIIKKQPEISKHTIKEIHQILSQKLLKDRKNVGNIRNMQVYIHGTDYQPLSDPLQIENELDKIISIYQSIENPYNRAMYIHNNLAYLQAFEDCNKRLARVLQNLSLINDDKIFLAFDLKNADIVARYKDGMLRYYDTGNYDISKSFFISEYKKTLDFIDEIEQNKKGNKK